MKKYTSCIIVLSVIFCLALLSCKKETVITMYDYANIKIAYKNFIQAPSVIVKLDTTTLASLKTGESTMQLIPLADKPVTLRIFKQETGELLFDSSFIPKRENNFTLFISDLLKLAEFYTPPAQPVNKDSIRLQLLNNIKIQGTGRKINFKFFIPVSPAITGFQELPGYELKNVEFGKMTAPIDFPVMRFPPPAHTIAKSIFIKAYDAETGALISELKTGSLNFNYGRVIPGGTAATAGEKHYITNCTVTESGSTVSYVKPFGVYTL